MGTPSRLCPRNACSRRRAMWLWFQIDGGLVAAIHVERHRRVVVGDLPGAVDLFQARGLPCPDIGELAADLGSADPDEAVAIGDLPIRGDADIARLVADRAPP